MGKTPRKYKGARTPQSLKEVRASARRGAVQTPKRSQARSLVAAALAVITGAKPGDAKVAVSDASSALDRAAKSGAIHKNAAARRKSRLAKKAARVAAGGTAVDAPAKRTAKSAAKRGAAPKAARGAAAKAAGATGGAKGTKRPAAKGAATAAAPKAAKTATKSATTKAE